MSASAAMVSASSILAASAAAAYASTFPVDLSATITPPPPPPGVTANFSESRNGTAVIAISFVAIICTTSVVCARLYTKAFLTRALWWDDALCVLAWIGALIYTAFEYQVARLGLGKEDYNVLLTEGQAETYYMFHQNGEVVYFVAVALMKLSLLLLYFRVFSSDRKLRFGIYGASVATYVSHLITLLITTLDTRPCNCHWHYDVHCKDFWSDDIGYIVVSVFTIVLDIWLLAIPYPVVSKLHMPRKQKLGVMAIFLIGIVVTLSSLLCLIFLIQWTYIDPDYHFFIWELKVTLTSIFEINLGIICACLSTLKAFVRRFAPSLLPITSHPSGGGGPTSQSHKRSVHGANTHTASFRHHLGKPGNWKWPTESGDEQLTGAAYLELGEDRKSDWSYAMNIINTVEVQPRSA